MSRNPFRRPPGVPDEVRARLPLDKGEKVLAGTMTRDGVWLVGTRDALLLPGTDGYSSVPWQQVERADWSRDDERLRVLEVGTYGDARPTYTYSIDEPGLLLELIRERVTASVVLQRRVPVEGKRGLFVIARRAPRGGSEITWAYEFDRGVDPENPEVMAAAERGLAAATEELGL